MAGKRQYDRIELIFFSHFKKIQSITDK